MKGTKWLSEAVDISDIKSGIFNVIKAPCGSGKTTFALGRLTKIASRNSKYLYVIDTTNGRDQILKNPNTTAYSHEWENFVKQGNRPQRVIGEYDFYDEDKIIVITYAKFGALTNKIPNFGYQFEAIICDEIHQGIRMTSYKNEDSSDGQYTLKAVQRLGELIDHSNVKIVGLSATPAITEKYFFQDKVHYIPVDPDVRQYETFETIKYNDINYIVDTIQEGDKVIVYVKSITQMKQLWEKIKEKGISKCSAIWSTQSKDHKMTDEQDNVRRYIIEKEKLPPDIDVLLINASCETGINIRGQVDYMFVHDRTEDTRMQVRGRYRDDLKKLYVLDYDTEIIVPDEYLDRPLSVEERKELCLKLKVKDNKGRVIGWPSLEQRLTKNHYQVTEIRIDNKRYRIITEHDANL